MFGKTVAQYLGFQKVVLAVIVLAFVARFGLFLRLLGVNYLAAFVSLGVQVAGLVVVRQAPPTANGHLFITLEDETGLANLIIRPDLYERERQLLHEADLLLVTGLTQRAGQASSLLVQAVAALQP